MYEVCETPEAFDAGARSSLAVVQSLHDSRQSILSGTFLTKANVEEGSLKLVGCLNLTFGVHQFPNTKVARGTIQVTVKPPVQAVDASQPGTTASSAPVQAIRLSELVFGFEGNPNSYFLVPRDSTLVQQSRGNYLYTFLTLRNAPGGNSLQYQVIPVSFPDSGNDQSVVEALRSHINGHDEVVEKMANATKHLVKMPLNYLRYSSTTSADKVEVKHRPPVEPKVVTEQATAPTAQSISKKSRHVKTPHSKEAKEPKSGPSTKKVPKKTISSDTPVKKQKKASIIPPGWTCEICGVNTTVMRRRGPSGLNCACNSCGQAWSQANRAKALLPPGPDK